MGTYRQPDIIVNSKGLLEQNKAISDFNKSLDSQFDKLRQQQIANNKISEQQERERQTDMVTRVRTSAAVKLSH